MKTKRIAARAFAIAWGLLVFAYVATFATAYAKGYEFRLFGGPLQFATASGKRYAMIDDGYLARDAGWTVYESIGRTGFFWRPVPDLELGSSFNGRHFGTDLVVSPDGQLLFVRRNTEAPPPDTPIWTDVLDLTSDPPTVVVRGPDCCMRSKNRPADVTDEDGLRTHGQAVVVRAQMAGAIK